MLFDPKRTYLNNHFMGKNGTFIVPAGVTALYVGVLGAGGAGSMSGSGTGGGFCFAQITVTPGQSIPVTCGGAPGGTSSFGTYISCTGGMSGGNKPSYTWVNGGIPTAATNAGVVVIRKQNGGRGLDTYFIGGGGGADCAPSRTDGTPLGGGGGGAGWHPAGVPITGNGCAFTSDGDERWDIAHGADPYALFCAGIPFGHGGKRGERRKEIADGAGTDKDVIIYKDSAPETGFFGGGGQGIIANISDVLLEFKAGGGNGGFYSGGGGSQGSRPGGNGGFGGGGGAGYYGGAGVTGNTNGGSGGNGAVLIFYRY